MYKYENRKNEFTILFKMVQPKINELFPEDNYYG